MAERLEWSEEFNIGVESIDKEHQQLFKIINKLFALKEQEKDGQWVCQEGIKFFKGHALKHFASEEAYMAFIDYEGFDRHRQVHRGFRENTLPALEEELERTGYSQEAVDHFLGVCSGWLIGHTMTDDLAITGKHVHRWENLLPEEEIAKMKDVISQLMQDMFHLDTKVISDAYGGEKFGKGIYYRLVYGNGDKEKRQEIFLVFEEKLLINTLSRIRGTKVRKLDATMLHLMRYTARRFVKGIMDCFPSMDNYELEEENLLSYDQFRRALKKKTLQAGLLFNTGGSGYFAYCFIAPHLLEEGIGVTIEHGNAMKEVENYLAELEEQEKKEEQKKKILVVDDSKTIRYFMRDLLFEDYEVTLADSGIAAIRAVTLNKPDLILLDYEMPVCDGKQTLEMLRSEKAFEALPVIFLTGRGDPESVRQVINLKPAGYLLKNMKPEDIKKEVKAFFDKHTA